MKTKTFEELVGKEFDFYGVNCNCFKLGTKVWEALEDPDDGYRSFMDSVVSTFKVYVFSRTPLARVKVVEEDDVFEGYKLVDVRDNHVWLRFGTEHYDYYYPYFVFDYQPKET